MMSSLDAKYSALVTVIWATLFTPVNSNDSHYIATVILGVRMLLNGITSQISRTTNHPMLMD